jgi:hypothetical protein
VLFKLVDEKLNRELSRELNDIKLLEPFAVNCFLSDLGNVTL